jgi:Ca-activated chloride channel family protein
MQRRKRAYSPSFGILIAALAAGFAWAGEAPDSVKESPSFRADTTLVLVPVTVIDRRGAIVSGLRDSAFTVTEDGAQRPIRSFSEEDAPVSLGIVLDLSGSMKGYLAAAKESLRALLADANPEDEIFVNGVSTAPKAYSRFDDSFEETVKRVESEDAEGKTALIDTICDSLKELHSGIHSRKALIVISDGMDNHSRYTSEELRRQWAETDAQIYTVATVAFLNAIQPPKPMIMTEAKRGQMFLEDLARDTGGISFAVSNAGDIAKAAASIGRALRNEYTIGYAPSGAASGKWRKISVKVTGSGLRAYARAGYRVE